MYESLQVPWSETPSAEELKYKEAGLQRTTGTLFILPPSDTVLSESYNTLHKGRNLSVGARALCKHYERREPDSGAHPFWTFPKGNEQEKSQTGDQVLQTMLKEAKWKNVLLLHTGVAIYEIRNGLGYGMRWTLRLTQ